MRQRLTSGTDIAMHWLYGPAAYPADVGDPIKGGKWKALCEQRLLLANCTGAARSVKHRSLLDSATEASVSLVLALARVHRSDPVVVDSPQRGSRSACRLAPDPPLPAYSRRSSLISLSGN